MDQAASTSTSIDAMRQNMRNLANRERRDNRDRDFNARRGILDESSDSEEDSSKDIVKDLGRKLKHKRDFTQADYNKLNVLLHDNVNIVHFLNVPGALQALIQDLAGQNALLQLCAAHCFCTLSLGDEIFCHLLTKAGAPYLVSNLDGLNDQLVETCAETLSNLILGGKISWSILHSQPLVPKLLQLIQSPLNNVVRKALTVLKLYVKMGMRYNKIEPNVLVAIARVAHQRMERDHDSLWLVYELSCSKACEEVLLANMVMDRTTDMLVAMADVNRDIGNTMLLVRILYNLSTGRGALALMALEERVLASRLKDLLKSDSPHLVRETIWLIGNLLNHASDEVQTLVETKNLHSNLKPELLLAVAITFMGAAHRHDNTSPY